MPLLMLSALYTRPDPPPPIILPIFHFSMPVSLLTKLSSTIPSFRFSSSNGTLSIIDSPSLPFALSFNISVFISSSDSRRTESTLGRRSLSGVCEELNRTWWLDLKLLSMLSPCMIMMELIILLSVSMRMLSPIRTLSPGPKPKIVFNYQPSPLRERPQTINLTPNGKYAVQTMMMASPNTRTNNFLNDLDRDAATGENRCDFCPKQATYRAVKEGRIYCSVCAIEVMKRGFEVVRIELKQQRFYKDYHNNQIQKENVYANHLLSPRVKEFDQNKTNPTKQRETELNDLLNNITHEQQELRQLLDKLSSQQLTSQGIKGIYHAKKISLKQHYERIKTAIKLSIQKDLEQLDKRQKTSIKCIDQKRQQLKDNIFLLEQIKQDVEPNKKEIISTIQEDDYQKMLNQHREGTKNILENKETSVQLVQQLTSHQFRANLSESEVVKQTQEQLACSRINQLYEPFTYTLIDTRQKKGQTLFSFQGRIK